MRKLSGEVVMVYKHSYGVQTGHKYDSTEQCVDMIT